MTCSTAVFDPGRPENPLYTKLRRRFSFDGDRTVAEYMMDRVRKNECSYDRNCPTAEHDILNANNLPYSRTKKKPARSYHPSKASIFLVVLCMVLLAGIVFAVYDNFRLKEKFGDQQNGISAYNEADKVFLPQSEGMALAGMEESADNSVEEA